MSDERWLPIPGLERYEVSDLGRVRSNVRKQPRILKPAPQRSGHLNVCIEGRTRLIHQLVLSAFVGPRPDGMEVRHLDGDASNNSLSNLRYGTRSENQQDAVAHGVHWQARKKECPRCGGPFSVMSYSGKTQRYCAACAATARRRYEQRKREGVNSNA